MKTVAKRCLVGVFALAFPVAVLGQESKSAPLAKELAAALDAAKLDSIAANDPSSPGVYLGALYFRGVQLLVISAKYPAPTLLDARLKKKEYRDVYIELNGAAMPNSKVFVEDSGVDGLKVRREENRPFDSFETTGKRTAFDGDWRKQKLSEEDYMKTFSDADENYSQILTMLLAQLKKTS